MALLNARIDLDYTDNKASATADALEALAERLRDTVEGDLLVPGEHGAVISESEDIIVRWWVSEE